MIVSLHVNNDRICITCVITIRMPYTDTVDQENILPDVS